jgi:aspartate/methionine/tyrosine aminotransferase
MPAWGAAAWILADDVYERLVYDGARAAPSFLDIADAGDRIVSTNSFSRSWLMIGWRLGWIVAPQPLMADLGKLIEYNTSCAPALEVDAESKRQRRTEKIQKTKAAYSGLPFGASFSLLASRAHIPVRWVLAI